MPTYKLCEEEINYTDPIIHPDLIDSSEELIKLSESRICKSEYIWNVVDLDLKLFQGRKKSPIFNSAGGQCQLVLRSEEPDATVLFVELKFLDHVQPSADVKINLFFLDKDNVPFERGDFIYFSGEMPCLAQISRHRKFKKNVLVDGRNFKIYCSVSMTIPKPEPRISFTRLLENKNLVDVVVMAGDVEFPAHRCILSLFSPVFANMFKSDTVESHDNVIRITDYEPEVVKKLLDFLYEGKVENIDEFAFELFQLAHKYMLESLKAECTRAICRNIRVENAAEVLALADLYDESEMKIQAKEFIVENRKEVEETDGYNKLSVELLTSLLEIK